MSNEIKNNVATAELITLDINTLLPAKKIQTIDLINWLDEGQIIREASFKSKLKSLNTVQFKDTCVAIFCSKKAIIPPWVHLLIQVKLRNIAEEIFFCEEKTMKILLFERNLKTLNMGQYKNKRVFLKGCSDKDFPLLYFSLCVTALNSIVKSLFYGEPWSHVLLIKN